MPRFLLLAALLPLALAAAPEPYPVSPATTAVPHPAADAPGETGWKRFDAYIFTERKYRDFVLDLEFKMEPTGNSGVFFCVADPLDPVAKGIELQILDTFGLAKPGHHDCGGIIRAMAASKNMVKAPGEWNRYTLTLKDRRLTVDFNGERTIVLDLATSPMKDRPVDGHIGFQDEAKHVWYRNVRIKELR